MRNFLRLLGFTHDAFGRLTAEYASAAQSAPCTTCYLAYDHLGSVRLVMDQNGNVVARHDYLPFGEEIAGGQAGRTSQFGATDGVRQRFTGQERDGETVPNLDYFHARSLSAEQGRFLSPDPANVGADPYNPQSWNGYAYVNNNPLALVDPSGMCASAVATNYDPQCQDGPWEQSNGSLAFQGGFADPFQLNSVGATLSWGNVSGSRQSALLNFALTGTAQYVTFDLTWKFSFASMDLAASMAADAGGGSTAITGPPKNQIATNINDLIVFAAHGKGERNYTAKPDKPLKGVRPVVQGGKVVGWTVPSPDGKRIPKSLDWGKANGLNANDPKWLAIGMLAGAGATAAADALVGLGGWELLVGAGALAF